MDKGKMIATFAMGSKELYEFLDDNPAVEFYDLANDPTEQNNLAGNSAYQVQIARMSAMLDDWIQQQGDTQQIFQQPYPLTGPKPREVLGFQETTRKAAKVRKIRRRSDGTPVE